MYRNFTAILSQFTAIFSGLGYRIPPSPSGSFKDEEAKRLRTAAQESTLGFV